MARELKCQYCEKKSPVSELVEHFHKANTGRETKLRFHAECLPLYLAEKEKKAIDLKEMDELYEVIKRLHKADVIPNSFFSGYIQPLRNGNFKMGNRVKKFKEGISYSLLKDAYLYCENSIEWARTNKSFKNTRGAYDLSIELKYCLAIVVGKLQTVKKIIKQKEAAKDAAKQHANIKVSQDEIKHVETEVKFKKKDNGKVRDLSDFLD